MAKVETWASIKFFENDYQVSSFGRVRSLDRFRFCKSKVHPKLYKGQILKARQDKDGYLIVNLKKDGKTHLKKVHRLVAEAFIENPLNKYSVNHKDGVKSNNNVDNLEWCSLLENNQHRTINRLVKPILNDNQIKYIKENVEIYNNGKAHTNSISDLAKKFKVCRNTVVDILKNRRLYLRTSVCR